MGAASVAMVLAAAALEEVMYRGGLFVHLLLVLHRWRVLGRRAQMTGAMVGSQLVFGLNHIPVGHALGLEGQLLGLYVPQVTCVGILFVVLFLRTHNLLLVTVMHALTNHPELPFVTDVNSSFVVLLVVLGFMLVRPLLMGVFVFAGIVELLRPSLKSSGREHPQPSPDQ